VAVESFDSVNSPSAIAVSVADDFFCSAFSKSSGLQDGFLGEGIPDDNGKIWVSRGQIYLHHIKWACHWVT